MPNYDAAQAARAMFKELSWPVVGEDLLRAVTALAGGVYEAGYTDGQRRAFEYYALSKPGFASTTNRNPFEDIQP